MTPLLAQLGRFNLEGLLCVGAFVLVVVLVASFRGTSRRCPRCQEVNRAVAAFCAQCGARLPGK